MRDGGRKVEALVALDVSPSLSLSLFRLFSLRVLSSLPFQEGREVSREGGRVCPRRLLRGSRVGGVPRQRTLLQHHSRHYTPHGTTLPEDGWREGGWRRIGWVVEEERQGESDYHIRERGTWK